MDPGVVERKTPGNRHARGEPAEHAHLNGENCDGSDQSRPPLCRATAETEALDGLEVVFKGGQIGGPDYFISLRDGAARV